MTVFKLRLKFGWHAFRTSAWRRSMKSSQN